MRIVAEVLNAITYSRNGRPGVRLSCLGRTEPIFIGLGQCPVNPVMLSGATAEVDFFDQGDELLDGSECRDNGVIVRGINFALSTGAQTALFNAAANAEVAKGADAMTLADKLREQAKAEREANQANQGKSGGSGDQGVANPQGKAPAKAKR
jgi:hypothetical protein